MDEVHGEFQSGRSLANWAIPRDAVINTSHGSVSNLYVQPSVVDNIFGVNYDGTQGTDEFLCHYSFGLTVLRNMSVNGIPTL